MPGFTVLKLYQLYCQCGKIFVGHRLSTYRKLKSCIKAATSVQFFNFFGAASIQVRLLFEGGLYAMF